MTHTTRLALAIALAIAPAGAALGCGGDATAPQNVSALNGTWTRVLTTGTIPGSSEQWMLAISDTVVTAHGAWSGEAGPSGDLTGTGYYSHGTLHLSLTLSTTLPQPSPTTTHQTFVGTLTSAQDLEGTLAYDGQLPAPVHMRKSAP